MRKQTISFLLALVLLLSLFPTLSAAGADSGRAGTGITWTLDRTAGVLSFEGSGRMYIGGIERDMSDPLWWRDAEAIREIRFDERITSISPGLFSMTYYASAEDLQRLRNVRRVTVPAAVNMIGMEAFVGCSRLDEIVILNPACSIENIPNTLGVPGRTVVAGYPDSTAERYAAVFGYDFRAIGCADGSHVFTDAVVTPADCEHEGVMERTCVLCGYKTREAIPRTHDYVITDRLASTVYTCTRCGDSYAVGESKRLRIEENTYFSVAAGACFSVCFTPEQTDRYYVDADPFGAWEAYGYHPQSGDFYTAGGQRIPTEYGAAVLKGGETYYYCFDTVYDDELRVRARVLRIHDFEETDDTSTCTAGGILTRVCSYCGETEINEIPPRGHEPVRTVVTAPTCTQEGLASYTCARCGERWTEVMPPEHDYRYDIDLPWYRHGVCARCGDVYVRGTAEPPFLTLDVSVPADFGTDGLCAFRFIPEKEEMYCLWADGEDYSLWGGLFYADGTPVQNGVNPYEICSLLEAGQTYYFVLERQDIGFDDFNFKLELVHDYWLEVVTPASCTSEGLTTYTCSICGESYTETIPEDHQWVFDVELPWYRHGVCALCGKQGEFGVATPPALSLDQSAPVRTDEDGNAFFSFTPENEDVYRFRLAEPRGASLRIYYPDGVPYTWDEDDSVQAYIDAGETVIVRVSGEENAALPDILAELAHRYIYVVTREPTCTEEGQSVALCRWCGDYITETLPPQHAYEYDVNLPWYRHGVCTVCGETSETGAKDPPALQTDSQETVRIAEPGSRSFLRFTAEQGGIYRFTLAGRRTELQFWSPSGRPVYRQNVYYGEKLRIIDLLLVAGQTCYIGVGFDTAYLTGDVRMRVNLECAVQRTELRPDQWVDVQLDGPQQYACCRFTPERSGYYEFRSEAPDYVWPSFWLQDGNGDELDYYDSRNGNSYSMRLWLEAGQTVDLVARTFDLPWQSYRLRVREVDSLFDAVPLVLDRFETVVLPSTGDNVRFSFTPEETGCYEFASYGGVEASCILIVGDGEILRDGREGHPGSDFIVRETLEAGKTYYFNVWSYDAGNASIPVKLSRGAFWSDPEITWEDGGWVAAYSFRMEGEYEWINERVQASRVITKEPTFTAAGEAVDIAVFENKLFGTQSRTVYLPPLGASELPCDGTDCPGAVFADMPAKGHWAHDAIDWALANGVTTGTGDAGFSPDAGCTRAQVATFLWRAAGRPLPEQSGNPFTDVDRGAYYYNAVLWALGEGVTTGATAEKFSPDAVCTRAQIVTFLWRFAGSPEPERAASFSDVTPGAYYEKAVAWAQEQGVTAGTSGGTFSPDSTCTRAQVVTFLYRALN